ncbi:hypothetical protein FA13DRAFT_1735677 [Coprinellus micaceus]|uniref:Uncharacterized protein n=1 Tax=Coprinellus micaceus TaxID=71717 RepID=A0A4Y7T2U4_COPMI|nr:hypothetical protein FA13DRAFT_1735677 [Coprinellus micaceus]
MTGSTLHPVRTTQASSLDLTTALHAAFPGHSWTSISELRSRKALLPHCASKSL